MRIKPAQAEGPTLDLLVAKAKGLFEFEVYTGAKVINGKLHLLKGADVFNQPFEPSSNWAQGGLIIDLADISVQCFDRSSPAERKWCAYMPGQMPYNSSEEIVGPTPLIAAMRCYVIGKLGAEVEIPEELTQ